MNRVKWLKLSVLLTLAAALVTAATFAAERQMNVRQGPETVFDRPVEQLFPQLQNAQATGLNGRVGGELVFWGYRMADGTEASLFACAILQGVDCEDRIAAICPVRTEVLARSEYRGTVVRRSCREACVSAPGDLRPCCTDYTLQNALQTGLVACR